MRQVSQYQGRRGQSGEDTHVSVCPSASCRQMKIREVWGGRGGRREKAEGAAEVQLPWMGAKASSPRGLKSGRQG